MSLRQARNRPSLNIVAERDLKKPRDNILANNVKWCSQAQLTYCTLSGKHCYYIIAIIIDPLYLWAYFFMEMHLDLTYYCYDHN